MLFSHDTKINHWGARFAGRPLFEANMNDLVQRCREALANAVAFARGVQLASDDHELLECADHTEDECLDLVREIDSIGTN